MLCVQEGKIPKLDKILDDSDEEIEPDKEIEVNSLLTYSGFYAP